MHKTVADLMVERFWAHAKSRHVFTDAGEAENWARCVGCLREDELPVGSHPEEGSRLFVKSVSGEYVLTYEGRARREAAMDFLESLKGRCDGLESGA